MVGSRDYIILLIFLILLKLICFLVQQEKHLNIPVTGIE
jgi:hypothetical protein